MTRRVRLTDQALVAVTIARQTAAAHGRTPTAADLIVGLGSEPDGWAGHLLRRREGALIALAGRMASVPPALAPLAQVVANAADHAAPRPPGTHDLLRSVLVVGGADLSDLLEACGFSPAGLWPAEMEARLAPFEADELWAPTSETVTLDPPDDLELTPPAARAVARTRAVAGGSVDLLLALASAPDAALEDLIGAVGGLELALARAQLEQHDPAAAADGWDRGLDEVLGAVAVLARERRATTADLLHATLVAGGPGPLAVLDAARARDDDEDE